MSIRPRVMHVIGISKEKIPDFKTWEKEFSEKAEDDLLEFIEDAWKEADPDDPFREEMSERFKNEPIFKAIPSFEDDAIPIVAVRPLYHYEESSLYDHGLVWAMVEAGVIGKENLCIKIPYKDYSKFIGMNPKDIAKEVGHAVASDMRYYDGNWARQYPNSSFWYFDADLEFAYQLFRKMGFEINREDVDRYFVFEWS